jgi:hypothetical protein
MKIDTEGYEMNVLRGAERSIRAGRVETITFEFGVHHVEARVFFKDFWSHLTQRGYALYYLEEGEITPITRYEYRWERFNRNYDFVASRRSIQ